MSNDTNPTAEERRSHEAVMALLAHRDELMGENYDLRMSLHRMRVALVVVPPVTLAIGVAVAAWAVLR